MDYIKFAKIRDLATFPVRGTAKAACWDLCAAEDTMIGPGHTAVVDTGLVVHMPDNYMMQILSRSGLASKGIIVANAPGIIDADYSPTLNSDPFDFEIKIILHNQSDKDFVINAGDRIAQASFRKTPVIPVLAMENWEAVNARVFYGKEDGHFYYNSDDEKILIERLRSKDAKRKGGLGSTGK